MTSTSVSSLNPPRLSSAIIHRQAWVWISALGVLFVLLHRGFLRQTARFVQDPDWSHAAVVPLISLYYLYQHRHQLAQARRRVSLWGLPILLTGLAGYALDLATTRNDTIRGYMMIVALFGLVWTLTGKAVMRVVWFPIVYLVFGIKITPYVWSRIAEALQDFASKMSYEVLTIISTLFGGFGVSRAGEGNIIELLTPTMLEPHKLNVAEACSGLRMLMAFMALGVALAFLFPRTWWQRATMILLAVPIALAVNVARVVTLGLLSLHDPDLAKGDFHVFVGMLMLIPAAGLFLLVGYVLDKVILRDDNGDAELAALPKRRTEPLHLDRKSVLIGTTVAVAMSVAMYGVLLALRDLPGVDRNWSAFAALPIVSLLGVLAVTAIIATVSRPRLATIGAFTGVGLALLFGGGFVLALSLTAGLLPDRLDGPVGWVLFAVLMSAGVAVLAAAPRWLRRIAPSEPSRRLTLGLGLIAGLLFSTLLVQGSVLASTGYVLVKKPVPLRQSLQFVPEQARDWKMVIEEEPLSSDIAAELGTDEYFSRHYLDQTVEQPADFSYGQPDRRSSFTLGSIARVHTAFYTGLADSVPHVPTRCYIGSGLEFEGLKIITLKINPTDARPAPDGDGYLVDGPHGKTVRLPTLEIPATLFSYSDPEFDGKNRHVIYFFAANGEFVADPLGVRLVSYAPRDRYSYYCKIETQIVGLTDPAELQERTEVFLSNFLPVFMAALPDWQEVQAGRWPPPPASAP